MMSSENKTIEGEFISKKDYSLKENFYNTIQKKEKLHAEMKGQAYSGKKPIKNITPEKQTPKRLKM